MNGKVPFINEQVFISKVLTRHYKFKSLAKTVWPFWVSFSNNGCKLMILCYIYVIYQSFLNKRIIKYSAGKLIQKKKLIQYGLKCSLTRFSICSTFYAVPCSENVCLDINLTWIVMALSQFYLGLIPAIF